MVACVERVDWVDRSTVSTLSTASIQSRDVSLLRWHMQSSVILRIPIGCVAPPVWCVRNIKLKLSNLFVSLKAVLKEEIRLLIFSLFIYSYKAAIPTRNTIY